MQMSPQTTVSSHHQRALLEKRGIPFEYVSPFVNEDEAKYFLHKINDELIDAADLVGESGDEQTMLGYAREIAKRSFDYSFQTGAVLATKNAHEYEVIDAACNEVVPYQTYALLHGNAREDNRVPRQGDQTYYDTIHAEMNLLVRAMKNGIRFEGKSLFINMMPCPNCARTLVNSGLSEVVYHEEHSGGYAVKIFEEAGIKTRKVEL
jgi:deoxycytidylate deaminase